MTDLSNLVIKVETVGADKAQKDLSGVEKQASATETATGRMARTMAEHAAGFNRFGYLANNAYTLAASAALGFGLAVNKALEDQQRLEKQLAFGLGRSAGVTADQFRTITDAAAYAAGVSQSSAREMAMTFAQTGQIGGEMFGSLIEVTKRYADVTGKDLGTASKDIAKAFSDPAKGAEQLAQALGASTDFLSIKTRDLIKNMAANGETTRAQGVLFDQLSSGPMPRLEKRIENLTDLWEKLKKTASDTGDNVVRSLFPSDAKRSETLQESLLNPGAERYKVLFGRTQQELATLMQSIDDMDARMLADMKSREGESAAVIAKGVQERVTAYGLEIRAIGAKTEAERAAISGVQAYNDAIRAGLGDQAARTMQLYAEEKAIAALTASIEDQIRAYQNQANRLDSGAGVLNAGGGMAAARARMQEEQQMAQAAAEIAAMQQRADQATGAEKERLGQTVAGLKEQYSKLAEAIYVAQKAQDNMTAASINNSLQQRLEMLQLETKMIGASTEARYRAIEALKTEQMIQNQMIFPNSAAADSIRMMSQAVVDQQVKLDKARSSVDNYAGSLSKLAMAAVGAGSAIKTAFAGAFDPGGASSGTYAIYSNSYAQARGGYANWQRDAQASNSAQQSELERTISMLERSLDRAESRWDNYQPSAYAEKNPLLFYDFQQGSHFTEAERTQIKAMQDQLSVAQKQLAELEQIAQLLNMPASDALRDPLTYRTDRNGDFRTDNFVNVGGVLVNKQLASIYGKTLGFATGGSFMVGGDGGTDTTPVRFMATKGERVTIETPAQQRSKMEGVGGGVRIDKQDNRTIQIYVTAPADARGGDGKLAADRLARDIAERVRRIA